MNYDLDFISEKDFKAHVKNTVDYYFKSMKPYDLEKFNKNIIDPVKLTFDKFVSGKDWSEIIVDEISRQRDKSNTNAIGYFHQNIFNYFPNCEVPNKGWDVIYSGKNKYYVEMKNKHNTMNSSSSAKTYSRLEKAYKNDTSAIYCLVEVIAEKSQDEIWELTVDGIKKSNKNIRRISLDKFYEIVTGDKDSFYKVCRLLPQTINEILEEHNSENANDTVINELESTNPNIQKALYKLAFDSYEEFENIDNDDEFK